MDLPLRMRPALLLKVKYRRKGHDLYSAAARLADTSAKVRSQSIRVQPHQQPKSLVDARTAELLVELFLHGGATGSYAKVTQIRV